MAKPGQIIFPILAHGSNMDSVDYPNSLITVLGKQIKGPKCILYGPGAKHTNPAKEEMKRHSNAMSVLRRQGNLANGKGVTGVTANTDKAIEAIEQDLEERWQAKKTQKYIVPIIGYSRGGVTAFHIDGALKKQIKIWKEQGRFPGLELEVHITVLDPVIGLGSKSELEGRVISDNVKKFTGIYYTDERRNAFKPQERTRLIFEDPNTEMDLELMPGYHYVGDHARNKKRDDVAIAVWHKISTSLVQSGVEFEYDEIPTALPVMPVEQNKDDPVPPEPISLTQYNPRETLKLYHRIKLTLPDYQNKGTLEKLGIGIFFDVWRGDRNLLRRNYVHGSHFLINKAEQKAFEQVFPKHHQHCIMRDKIKPLTKVQTQIMDSELDQERPRLEEFYQETSLEFYRNEQNSKKPEKITKLAEQMTASIKKSLYQGENITVVKPGIGKRVVNGFKSLVGGVLKLGFKFLGETALAVANGLEQIQSRGPINVILGMGKVVFSPIMGLFNTLENTAEPFESRHPEYQKFIPPTGRKKNIAESFAQAFVNQLLTYKRNMFCSHEGIAVRLEVAVDSIMSADKNTPNQQYSNLLRLLNSSLKSLDDEGYNYQPKTADGLPCTLYGRLRWLHTKYEKVAVATQPIANAEEKRPLSHHLALI